MAHKVVVHAPSYPISTWYESQPNGPQRALRPLPEIAQRVCVWVCVN
jgi:hypothetical protein